MASILLLLNILNILTHIHKIKFTNNYSTTINKPLDVNNNNNNKNIYVLILDAYPNNAVLKKSFNFDNKDFIDFLNKKEFFIYNSMYANYTRTCKAIPSLLNHKYYNEGHIAKIENDIGYSTFLQNAYNQNYYITYINDNYWKIYNISNIKTINNKIQINYNLNKDPVLSAILKNPIYKKLLDIDIKDTDKKSWKMIKNNIAAPNKKSIVIAHINAPHHPYWRNENFVKIKDNSDIIQPKNYITNKKAFIQYLKYTNKRTKEIINIILQKDPTAYIVITGDHGIRLNNSDDSEKLKQIYNERNKEIMNSYFNTFTAVYTNKKLYNNYKKQKSLINFFIEFSNEVFNTKYKNEPDILYFCLDSSCKTHSPIPMKILED